MNLSDKLSPEDRRAYAEAYEPLAKQRDAYVACGDQVNAKKIRRQISDLSRFYQNRADKRWFSANIPGTSFWLDESSKFMAADFGALESRMMAHMNSSEGNFIMWPRCAGKSTFFKQLYDKFHPPKEPQMLKITNSSDMPQYSTEGRACVSISHLLSKEQMLEVAKMAYNTYGTEMLSAIGMKETVYDEHRAIKELKRGLAAFPEIIRSYFESCGYRKIQPYNLEVAQRQVADALRVFPHHFNPKSGLPGRFYNHAVGHQAPDVAHFHLGGALQEAERIARRTNAEVRTYQLVSTTTIEDVPTTTKQVVRRP